MSITYPVSLPSVTPAQVEWGAMTAAGETVSPFTLAQQVYRWPGERWQVAVRYPRMKTAEARQLIGILRSLLRGDGTFLFGPSGDDATFAYTGTEWTGTVRVAGATQTGESILLDGFTGGNGNRGVTAGDYFGLGTVGSSLARLHMVLQTANINASGEVTVDLWPRIREAPADNFTVIKATASPKANFRLRGGLSTYEIGTASIYGVSFEAVEAF